MHLCWQTLVALVSVRYRSLRIQPLFDIVMLVQWKRADEETEQNGKSIFSYTHSRPADSYLRSHLDQLQPEFQVQK